MPFQINPCTTRMVLRRLALLAGIWLPAAVPAFAHKGSDAYLDVQEIRSVATAGGTAAGAQSEYRFALAVAIKDLDLLVPLDANADGKVTWGEARAAMPQVLALVNETANIEAPGPGTQSGASACHLSWQSDGFDRRSDGAYVRLVAQARCPAAQVLAFHYSLLREQDANHRLLVAGHIGGKDLLTTTSPQQPSLVLRAATGTAAGAPALGNAQPENAQPLSNAWAALGDYFSLGVQHLLRGYDHLAFLLALVLPLRLVLFGAVRAGAAAPAQASGSLGEAAQAEAQAATRAPARVWWALLRTITAFTIGHSVTLILATLGWTQASPRWVEPAIALTIIATALLNLRRVAWVRTDVLALLFGMVHGYGFAGLLLEAAAPSGLLPWALAGFNLGVEGGQLIAVCAWVLLCQPMVAKPWYPTLVVRGGSVVLVLLAAFWFWQRI